MSEEGLRFLHQAIGLELKNVVLRRFRRLCICCITYISGNRPEVGTNREDDGLKDLKNAASLRRKVRTIQINLGSIVFVPAYAKNRTNFGVPLPFTSQYRRFLP